jgi:dihydrolipoamide dehydrogenase
MSAYRAALAHTPRVLVIEGGVYGTTCARVGCMPSKLLIAAAEAAHAITHAGRFGVHGGPLRVDGEAVMAAGAQRARPLRRLRRRRRRALAAEHRCKAMRTLRRRPRAAGGMRTRGRGRPHRHRHRFAARRAARLAAALGERLIVNDDVFNWTDLPRSVAVVGAGVIGLELAQALHRLGVRVRLYGRSDHVGPLTDPALQALAREVFAPRTAADAGLASSIPVREGDAVVVRATRADGTVDEERFDWLLAATGRRPTSTGLGLEATTLPLDPARRAGVTTAAPRRSACSPVFIAGDALDDRPLLHEAADEGRIAGDNAGRFPDVRVRPRRAPLAVVFSDPQIALAGASHAELQRAGAPSRPARCRSPTRAAAA